MRRLQIDILDDGALPMYNMGLGAEERVPFFSLDNLDERCLQAPQIEGEQQRFWTRGPTWNILTARPERILVPLNLDVTLDNFQTHLPACLETLEQNLKEEESDGTYLFSVRGIHTLSVDYAPVGTNASTSNTSLLTTDTTGTSSNALVVRTTANTDSTFVSTTTSGDWNSIDYIVGGLVYIPRAEFGVELHPQEDVAQTLVLGCLAILVANQGGDAHEAVAAALRRYSHGGRALNRTQPLTEAALFQAVEGVRQRNAERLETRRLEMEKRKQATARAHLLLRECLPARERRELEQYGSFHIVGKDGYTYLIEPGNGHNVYRIEEGQRTMKFCIISEWKHNVPTPDLMLGQKLLLETNPEEFYRIANKWRLE